MTDNTTTQQWRWIDEKGRAMTDWSTREPPPESMRELTDAKGVMRVEFKEPSDG